MTCDGAASVGSAAFATSGGVRLAEMEILETWGRGVRDLVEGVGVDDGESSGRQEA